MIIKNIYIQRIDTWNREYLSFLENCKNKVHIIKEYGLLIEEISKDVISISHNTDLEPNIKYIKLGEKTKEFEKISDNINKIQEDIDKKVKEFKKSKSLIIEGCMSDNISSDEDSINNELNKLFK